ncbi:hypothetical protein L208DRAFT_1272208 [Tricholoma matsutake]|nr:hypothetical protein L208DRAFT_1272208 [Tricholoma matsutake 945]
MADCIRHSNDLQPRIDYCFDILLVVHHHDHRAKCMGFLSDYKNFGFLAWT